MQEERGIETAPLSGVLPKITLERRLAEWARKGSNLSRTDGNDPLSLKQARRWNRVDVPALR
jgi:hypothetical protein